MGSEPDPRFTGRRPNFADQLERVLLRETERIASVRDIRAAVIEGQQAKKVLNMSDNKTLIKGLSEAVAAAKKSIAEAKSAPAALQESAAALVATCKDLKTQVDAMHEDIKFEASQLGNGG